MKIQSEFIEVNSFLEKNLNWVGLDFRKQIQIKVVLILKALRKNNQHVIKIDHVMKLNYLLKNVTKFKVISILELQKGAKRPHCNFDFINKIEVKI